MVNKRDYRLDLVRVLAIVGVVTLHVAGGVDYGNLGTINKLIVGLMLALARCSVNLFGLLSGYLKIDRPQHHASMIKIIFATFFWCIIITIIGAAFFGLKAPSEILYNAFPLLCDRLWYISCYCFVFLCAPFLNLLVRHLSKSGYKRLLILLTILMSLIPTICMIDFFHIVSYGYSAGWLLYLYLLGGYFKLYGFKKDYKKVFLIVVLFISSVIMVGSLFGLQKYVAPFMTGLNISFDGTILYSYYNSPLVLLNSIIILYLCVNTREIKNVAAQKAVQWVSVVSLGIYVIHSHPVVLDYVLNDKNLGWTTQWNPAVLFLILLGLIVGVVLLSGLLEQIRMWIFKLCRIDKLTKLIGSKLDSGLSIK